MLKSKPMTCDEQTDLWVAGESIHNSTRDECCPDFSCCCPENAAPMEDRIKFKNASREEQETMLYGWLFNMLKHQGLESAPIDTEVIGVRVPSE